MDAKNTNFRIILALTNIPQDVNLNGTSLKVTLANNTKTIPLTNKEATPLDFSGVQSGSKLEFGLEDAEGFMFGYAEHRIPTTAFEKNETEVNEQIRFYLINKEKDSFVCSIYAIFLNKGLFKEKAKERGSLNKARSPLKTNTGERLSSRSPSASSPNKRSPSKVKAEAKSTEKNFQAYLNRLVDSHSTQLKTLVDEHNSINEFIHLNKLQNNLPQSFAQDSLETYSPLKLKSANVTRGFGDSIEGESALTVSQSRVAKFGGEESRVEETSVLRDLSPIAEREKRSAVPIQEDEESPKKAASPSRLRDRSTTPSPLKTRGNFERKLSEGSNNYGSPAKRKTLADLSMLSANKREREVVDATFLNAQITTLNNVIINQNSRIADLEVHQKENEDFRNITQKSEVARKALQESILETTNELKQENQQLERQVATVVVEKEGLLKKNADLQNTINDLNNSLASTRATLQEKEDLNAQNAIKLAELSDLRQQFKKLQEVVINTESQKARDQETYKAALARFEASLLDTTRAIDNLNQEKKKLVENLHQVQQELGLESANHQATQTELLLTRKKLENAENYKNVINSLESQRDQLTQQLSESRNNHAQVQQSLQESVEKLASRQREFESNERTFSRDVNNLNERLATSESKNDRAVKEINEHKVKISQLNTTVAGLEQLVVVKEDIGRQLENTVKQLTQAVEDRNTLRTQLETIVVSQDQTNAKLFETEKVCTNLRQTIDEKEDHIEQLTVTVIALRESMETYVPVRGDVVDSAVADYINTGNDISRLKLLFIRETEGVYQFGSKRVYIKLEGGRVLVRVGGGFLTLEEFLEQYGSLETEKLSRNDPLKKLSKNIAMNKTLIGKCVNQMEKTKNQAYEYRTDASGNRALNSSPSLQRLGSKGDY